MVLSRLGGASAASALLGVLIIGSEIIANQREDAPALRRLTNSSARYPRGPSLNLSLPSAPTTKPTPSPRPSALAVRVTSPMSNKPAPSPNPRPAAARVVVPNLTISKSAKPAPGPSPRPASVAVPAAVSESTKPGPAPSPNPRPARAPPITGAGKRAPLPSATPVRVALLLTGHARTFEKTSQSIHQNLIRANPQMSFVVFIATYNERDTKTNGMKHHTNPADTVGHLNASHAVTKHELISRYAPLPVHVSIHKEQEVMDLLPSKFNRAPGAHFSPVQYRKRRTLAQFRLIYEGYKMVMRATKHHEPFDLVIKLRLDCWLSNGWPLKGFISRLKEKQAIVMPAKLQFGDHHYRPEQLKTKPCDKDGGKTPTWVSDHIAFGSMSSMRWYAAEMTGVDGNCLDSQGRPEVTLANFLKRKKVQVWCDPTILYTINRKNIR